MKSFSNRLDEYLLFNMDNWAEYDYPHSRDESENEGASTSIQDLDRALKNENETFQEMLLRLIDENELTDVSVYQKLHMDRRLFSKIRCNKNYQPKLETAVMFALALKLSSEKTDELLKTAGYALSPSKKFDRIIKFFIINEIYDIDNVNEYLERYGQPLLGV